MEIRSDNVFLIGSGHKVCQDYSLHDSTYENEKFIVVSDGCSSSPDTDIGSRLLCKSVLRNLKSFRSGHTLLDLELMLYPFLQYAGLAKHNLDLKDECLDATLLVALTNQNVVEICAWGDGVIIVDTCKEVISYQIDYNNMPYYPNYISNSKRSIEFDTIHKDGPKVTLRVFNKETNEINYRQLCSTNNSNDLFSKDKKCIRLKFDMNKMKSVILSTDGITSFFSTDEIPDISNLILDLSKFKNFNGEFLKRRVTGLLRQYSKFKHFDDLGLASFCILED